MKTRSLKEVFSLYMKKNEIKKYRGNMDFMFAWKDFIFENFEDACLDVSVPWDFEYFFDTKHILYNVILDGWGKDYVILKKFKNFIISKEFLKMIEECDKRLIVSIIGIHNIGASSHANGIIVDNESKKIYRYEPLGEYRLFEDDYEQNKIIDQELEEFYNYLFGDDYTFIPSLDYCPRFGLQMKSKTINYCAAWTMMFLHEQLLNPHKSPEKIFNRLNNLDVEELDRRIHFYVQFLVKTVQENGKFILN